MECNLIIRLSESVIVKIKGTMMRRVRYAVTLQLTKIDCYMTFLGIILRISDPVSNALYLGIISKFNLTSSPKIKF